MTVIFEVTAYIALAYSVFMMTHVDAKVTPTDDPEYSYNIKP